jgi:hypothetical protein
VKLLDLIPLLGPPLLRTLGILPLKIPKGGSSLHSDTLARPDPASFAFPLTASCRESRTALSAAQACLKNAYIWKDVSLPFAGALLGLPLWSKEVRVK